MAVYQYKALNKGSGKTVKGIIDADSAAQARQKLREQALYPTQINETEGARAKAGEGVDRFSGRGRGRVSTRDLALMTRQLAVLMRAGMPIVGALTALLDQVSKARLKGVLYDVRDKVNSGSSLADALKDHPRIFSDMYVNLVRAGETSGQLEDVLLRLAEVLDNQAKIKAQVLSSIAYPAFMGVFAIAVIVFLMMVIVPRLTQIFESQEADLPRMTEMLIGMSDFVAGYWWAIIAVVFGSLSLWRLWISRPEGRRTWDRIKLRFPLYGNLHIKLVSARFARTLGTMLQSGITMLPALDVVISVMGNAHIQKRMADVKAGVRRGRDLSATMREMQVFPSMMLHMIDLGQRSGEIEEMLLRVAETYDEDVRLTIDAVVGLIEPAIIILMGLFVGFLVMAILLPIVGITATI